MTSTEKAAAIARDMAAMGFEPSSLLNESVEYVKDYVDGLGRVTRVTAIYQKTQSDRPLDGYIITTQQYVPADPEKVELQAPAIARRDLSRLAQEFGPELIDPAPIGVIKKTCSSCAIEAQEFYVVEKKPLCRDCYATTIEG
jgi:hypothetical protein